MANKPDYDSTMRLDMCGFELMKNPFGFKFVDTRDRSNTLLTTEGHTFIMYDKFMQMDLVLPSQRIYGLGERRHEFGLGQGTWTMWANGQETPYDSGIGGHQTYGVHPFVLVQTKNQGEYMGLYFRNSNAQSPIVNHNEDGSTVFSYITTGGQIEVYFFFKGTAKQII
jgi:alpha-glucosidase (family GH31 glycosyl hydrolase)